MKIINENSYRILGLFSNASKKEIVGAKSMFNAFLRVNQPIPAQKYDLQGVLPEVNRTLDLITKAESELAVSKNKVMQNMFWFACMTDNDNVCMDLVAGGEFDKAIDLWKKEGTVESLQNMMICHLINKKYTEAVILACNIITVHFQEWLALFSLLPDVTPDAMAHLFIDMIYSELQETTLGLVDWSGLPKDWAEYAKNKTMAPFVNAIISRVDECKDARKIVDSDRISEAVRLKDETLPLLDKLTAIIPGDVELMPYCDMVVDGLLNLCIENYNFAYKQIEFSNFELFRAVAPQCVKILDGLDNYLISVNVCNRYKENVDVMKKDTEDIEGVIDRCIAAKDDICWFCGERGETHVMIKKYSSFKLSKTSVNVNINTCGKCKRELEKRREWKLMTAFLLFLVLCFIVLTSNETDIPRYVFLLLASLSLVIGVLTGPYVRKVFCKKKIRQFKRETDDHPLVKQAKSEGYSFEEE